MNKKDATNNLVQAMQKFDKEILIEFNGTIRVGTKSMPIAYKFTKGAFMEFTLHGNDADAREMIAQKLRDFLSISATNLNEPVLNPYLNTSGRTFVDSIFTATEISDYKKILEQSKESK